LSWSNEIITTEVSHSSTDEPSGVAAMVQTTKCIKMFQVEMLTQERKRVVLEA
jgi:hypothetical protein